MIKAGRHRGVRGKQIGRPGCGSSCLEITFMVVLPAEGPLYERQGTVALIQMAE